MSRVRELRQRRAIRLAVRADKRLARLSPLIDQSTRRGSSLASPRPGGRLVTRLRTGVVVRVLTNPRTAEGAALAVGVVVGVVLVAVLVGSLLTSIVKSDLTTPGEV